jgi:hypothetical protein
VIIVRTGVALLLRVGEIAILELVVHPYAIARVLFGSEGVGIALEGIQELVFRMYREAR